MNKQVLLEDGGPYAFVVPEVRRVRPHRLFSLLEVEGPERVAHVRLSKRRGLPMAINDNTVRPEVPDSSLLYLETMVLVGVLKITRATRALEFGTHLGSTTLNIALNLPEHGEVLTLDLMPVDRFKEWRAFRDAEKKITAIGGIDSSAIASLGIKGAFDFIWIDGNPDRTDDTRNAFKFLDNSKLSCIGWHDYGVPGANTTEVVNGLAADGLTIYHIEETKVALYFNRPVDL